MCQDLDGSIVCCETEQAMNRRECSEIVFNNGYSVIIMASSSIMMDNILQPPINTVKHLIYYYFSTTFEVSKLDIIANLKLHALSNKLLRYTCNPYCMQLHYCMVIICLSINFVNKNSMYSYRCMHKPCDYMYKASN